jgi:hypothetical protein
MGLFSFLKPKSSASYEEVAGEIIWHIAKASFEKFKEADFRQKVNFETIEQVEQDRIFNELVITGMALVYLTMEIGENLNPKEKSKQTFRGIKNNLASSYIKTLREGGVEKSLQDMWYQLLAMRCEEYRKDYKDYKHLFADPRQNHWVHITAIGGSDHIGRGEVKTVEAILPQITRWCGSLSTETQRIIAKNALVLDKDGNTKNVKIGNDGKIIK